MRSAYAFRRWLAREILECEIPASPPSGLPKAQDLPLARYRAWIRLLLAGGAAHKGPDGGMGKKPQTIRASLYTETATCKIPTPTIDWDEPNSNGGTK
jgi:hypothetical protein